MTHLKRWVVCVALIAGCGGAQTADVKPAPMPLYGTFTGVWFSPQYGRMDLVQSGKSVIGEYGKDEREGRIQGFAKGNLLKFQWTEHREMIEGRPSETKGRGYFQYVVDREGAKLIGEWGHENNEIGGGPWNAAKSKLKPSLQHPPKPPENDPSQNAPTDDSQQAIENIPRAQPDSPSKVSKPKPDDLDNLGDL